jgi:hexosaminidase
LGDEGYELRIAPGGVEVVAGRPAGFGWAVQTIRQLLPAEVAGPAGPSRSWWLPEATIRDVPRFAWRGVMLDVARHFFAPGDVERVIDLAALYKLNRFHLHLTDDQGWRLEIRAHPELTEIGATTSVGGGPGGNFSQREYAGLVAYAARRGIVVVPEIDMPGHTQAALASIPWLNGDGRAPPVATDPVVLTSSLDVDRAETDRFVEEVLAEVAELTPGPYVHIGGDESLGTDPAGYRRFIERTVATVRAVGKRPIGWDEIATADVGADAIVQHWIDVDHAEAAARRGMGIIMSPAGRTYLDMKYDESTPVGTAWAGFVDTPRAYRWDPRSQIPGLPGERVLGLEAPLWTETVTTLEHIEAMMLPRLPAYAEIGWSPAEGRTWEGFRDRLGAHGKRWTASGRAFTRDPAIGWT